MLRSRRNPSNKRLAVLEMHVTVVAGHQFPPEQPRIKLPGRVPIRSIQISPTNSPRNFRDPRPNMRLRLPDANRCPRRILQHRHPPIIRHIERTIQQLTAQLHRLRRRCVRILHRNVQCPIRRHALRPHLWINRVRRTRIPPVLLKHRVELARTHRRIIRRPPKQRLIEFLRGLLIARQ